MFYLQSALVGGILLLPALGMSAPKDFCQTYAQSAVKQYWMMKEDPSYECHPDKEYMPLWTPDPSDHYNWCTHKAVSTYKAGRELERRERFLVEACQYDLNYAEISIPAPPPKVEAPAPKKGKSVFSRLFHKRVKQSSTPPPPAPVLPKG